MPTVPSAERVESSQVGREPIPTTTLLMAAATMHEMGRLQAPIHDSMEYSVIEHKTDAETADAVKEIDQWAKDDPNFGGGGWNKARPLRLKEEEDRRRIEREYPDKNKGKPFKVAT